jgi:hypothetical protein
MEKEKKAKKNHRNGGKKSFTHVERKTKFGSKWGDEGTVKSPQKD